jgi:aspartate/methionine/tyrosine aminotransferase
MAWFFARAKVMDVVAAAAALEATGRTVLHLEVGQPLSGAPPEVCAAAAAALERERLGYTVAQVDVLQTDSSGERQLIIVRA